MVAIMTENPVTEPGEEDAIPAMPEDADAVPEPSEPPSVGRQAAQLFIIPSLIVMAGMGVMILFVWIINHERSLRDDVAALRGCAGSGRGVAGMLEPAFKDCMSKAHGIANRIPSMTDPEARAALSEDLTELFEQDVTDEEGLLRQWLPMAIGQLGVKGSEGVLFQALEHQGEATRVGALKGLLAWPDQDAQRAGRTARAALPRVMPLLHDGTPDRVMFAAMLLGEIGLPEDEGLADHLVKVLGRDGLAWRDARWAAAVALARLGDRRGSRVVEAVLLDRAVLATLPVGPEAKQGSTMPSPMQDRVIFQTLRSAGEMTDPAVVAKIRSLAADDVSPLVKKQARDLLYRIESSNKTPGNSPPVH